MFWRLLRAAVMRWGLARRLVHHWCIIRPSTRVLLAGFGLAGLIIAL